MYNEVHQVNSTPFKFPNFFKSVILGEKEFAPKIRKFCQIDVEINCRIFKSIHQNTQFHYNTL